MPTKFGTHFPAVRKGRERRKLMILALAAVAATAFTFLLAAASLSKRNPEAGEESRRPTSRQAAQAAIASVNLFAPVRDVRAGTPLDGVQFRDIYWPRHNVPEGAVLDRAEFRGKFADRDLQSGLPITKADLSLEPKIVNLPITPGMRAVSIQVDATSSIEGWARPGSRVDVVLTYDQGGELTSKLISQNVRILSAGGESGGTVAVQTTTVRPVQTVTLEVRQEDALAIMTARQLGRLNLVMRSSDDQKTSEVTEKRESDISGVKRKPVQASGSSGTVRIGGREYMVGRGGELTELINIDTP